MKAKTYLFSAALLLLCKTTFALPAQEDFYHKYYKIESKAFSGKVLTRTAKTGFLIKPALEEHVSLNYAYSGSNSQKWIIAPLSPNSSEFYIINKETGFPLMIDGNTVKCNTSGITDDRQRFKFKNINGDYFQVQSASIDGCFYKMQHKRYNGLGQEIGYYYSLYYSNSANLNDDYSFFKLTAVEDIPGTDNVSASNLVHQPGLLFNIPAPPQLTSYTCSAPDYLNETVIGESWIPFTLIHDDSYSPAIQVTRNPFYKLIRTQAWKKIKDFSYESVGSSFTTTCKHYKGINYSLLYTAQNAVGHSWSLDGTAEFQLPALETALGSSYSERLSTPVTLVNEYTKDTWLELSENLVFKTQASVRFVVYQLVDRYYIKRMDGLEVISPVEYYNSKYYKYKTWSSRPTTISRNTSSNEIIISDDYTPQNFTVGVKNNHPCLQWNASTLPGLSYYEIWKKKHGIWSLMTKTADTCYTNTNELIIAASTYVYYKICAVDNTGKKSGFTDEIKFCVTGNLLKENPGSTDSLETGNVSAALQIQNYPNPFNPSTSIRFNLPEADKVLLQVFDITGRLVTTLIDGRLGAGNHDVVFNAQTLSSGIYIYRITTSENTIAKRMLLLK